MGTARLRTTRVGIAGAVVAAACLGVLALAGSSSASEGLPRCPPFSVKLLAEVPDYGRPGQGIPVLFLSEGGVENVTMTVVSTAGETTTPVTLEGEKTRVILGGVPAPDPEAHVVREWDQDLGTASACHGRYDHPFPVFPYGTRVGEQSLPRLSGAFRIKEPLRPKRGQKMKRPVWRFRPYCDYFACDVHVRSTLTLKGRMRLTAYGRYKISFTFPPTDSCAEKGGRGKLVAKKVYYRTVTIELRVTRERNGRVLAFRGKRTTVWRPTARGERLGCILGSHEFEQLSGQRIGHG